MTYDTHDADDALELGLLELTELLAVPLWREAARRVLAQFAALAGGDLRRAVLHELIDWQVGDLLEQTQTRLGDLRIDSVESVRRAPVVVRHVKAERPSREIVVAWRAGSSRAAEGRLLAETLRGA